MSDYENTTAPSIGWVKQYVESWMEQAFRLIGAEMGTNEKAEHERMKAYVDEQAMLSINLLGLEIGKVSKIIEEQAKTIESQGRQIKALEAKLTNKRKAETDRATNGQIPRGNTPMRLS